MDLEQIKKVATITGLLKFVGENLVECKAKLNGGARYSQIKSRVSDARALLDDIDKALDELEKLDPENK